MTEGDDARTPGAGGYAPVNGLNMYYEIHGTASGLAPRRLHDDRHVR
ncbi:MAG: hypothetical protein K0S10_2461 [Rubrobacteraceae bacterium]|nr:hypothetical protein [Rubrobacteraceae bacterium]